MLNVQKQFAPAHVQTSDHPGQLLKGAVLHEIIPDDWKNSGAAIGLTLAVLQTLQGPCLWAQMGASRYDLGTLFGPGLQVHGINPDGVMLAQPRKDIDLLGMLEEGLTTPGIAAVVGVLPASSRSYDLTASRRLSLRAHKYGVPVFVLRYGPGGGASAATHRWRVASVSRSCFNENISRTFGRRWHVDLVKSRTRAPGQWVMDWNHETHSISVDALFADRTIDPAIPFCA